MVENRGGQRGVWGVQITLDDSRFKPTIAPGELRIIEGKHDRDITDMMQWSISDGGARLTILFKPGMGDFGSGNTVTVRVTQSALVNYHLANKPEWTVSTDPTGEPQTRCNGPATVREAKLATEMYKPSIARSPKRGPVAAVPAVER